MNPPPSITQVNSSQTLCFHYWPKQMMLGILGPPQVGDVKTPRIPLRLSEEVSKILPFHSSGMFRFLPIQLLAILRMADSFFFWLYKILILFALFYIFQIIQFRLSGASIESCNICQSSVISPSSVQVLLYTELNGVGTIWKTLL